jgi:uncharacterized membrane protein YgaE (UPF0421/DUF939 family)
VEVEVALKAAVAAGLATYVSKLIGLSDSYWAAISAVVATEATLGASLASALARVAGTLVGLVVGLAAVGVAGGGTLVGAATVLVALLVLPALSLDRGVRLGAATTLIVVAFPGSDALNHARSRGLNVPLGCSAAVLVGFVLLPKRAGERLRADVLTDIRTAGELARSAMDRYTGERGDDGDLRARVRVLSRAHASLNAMPFANPASGATADAASSASSRQQQSC